MARRLVVQFESMMHEILWEFMENRQALFRRLMAALVCSFGCVSSFALAQQKLDQMAVESR
jgi:hypothetical protein